MAKSDETWYDSQALNAKLITYAAILIFVGCFAWALYIVHVSWDALPQAVLFALGGIAVPAFLVGISAIIDLLIVNAEALRAGKR